MLKWGHAIRAAGVGAAVYAYSGAIQVHAADMPLFGDDPAQQTKVEFGSGWYIRGDLAYASDAMPAISSNLSQDITSARQSSMSAGLGFGYKFNNWIRADLVGDYRMPQRAFGIGASQTCITGQELVNNAVVTTATDQCSPHQAASVRQWDLLPNIYIDLGTWYGITPYIGGGAGLSITRETASSNWFMTNGLPYQVTTDAGFYYNWDSRSSSMTYQFAWALMAGAAYQLTDQAFVDVGYRYLNLGTYTAVSSSGATATKRDDVHEFRVGIRYMADWQ